MPKELCIENPSYQEIKDVLTAANMNMLVENKIYPRERSKVSSLTGSSIPCITEVLQL